MAKSQDYKYDVFLSYQRADETEATALGQRLEDESIDSRKISIFYAPWDIAPGQNFVDRINEGLEKARFFVLLLSQEALNAEWPTAERASAIISDPSGRLGRVIPVMVRPCKIPPLLAFRNYVDFRDKTRYESEFTRLLCVIKAVPLPRGKSIPGKTMISEKTGTSPLTQLASEPDDVPEELYSNLFTVRSLPTEIWSAPTTFTEKRKVFEYFGRWKVPLPFILRENHLFTFTNLSIPRNPFRGVIEDYDISSFAVDLWMEDKDHLKWLVQLLNDAIRTHCRSLGMRFDTGGKKYYYPQGILKNEKVVWFPHVRKSARSLIIEYKKDEKVIFIRHRAVNLRFVLLGKTPFLRIDPGLIFSLDGRTLIEGRRRSVLNTRLISLQKNSQELDETRFWAWLLSDDGKTIKFDIGGHVLQVETKPVLSHTDFGIFGDWKEMPQVVEKPPELVEITEEEEVEPSVEDLEEEGEDENE